MKRVHSIYTGIVLSVALLTIGCRLQPKKDANPVTPKLGIFTLPAIPALLTAPQDRTDYLVSHYWQNFDFADTMLISKPEITEQALADFLNLLPRVSSKKAEEAITSLMKSTSADGTMSTHFMKLTEKYLYDPNSPYRNEEYYIPVLRYAVSSDKLDESSKVRSRYQLEMALKNRPGTVAADFIYTIADGRTGRMKNIEADFTLLFFNSPDCPDCKRVKDYIDSSTVFTRMLHPEGQRKARLKILAVYPDTDLTLWRKALYPTRMINSYDAGGIIEKQQLYDLKAIPTLYLLDKDKQVILKDAPVELVEDWFRKPNKKLIE